ncbi:MAG TPA: alpha-L-arabinofuranosidase C-terminal domain-containing protein [Acidobacteriaceae bacterium]|nr:alpha-L-arabinofuranosidase C-terminal domain-containing protein [Acidobacteriaceae bacterium]
MPPVVTVQVDAGGNLGQVPPRIFGTFIEPIDNSIDNGVVAEILVNGSLEGGLWNHAMLEEMFRDQPELIESSDATGIPLPWEPLNTAAGNRYELHVGEAANSWQSLEIMGMPDQLAGIMQRVYLPVPRTFTYNVSFYARQRSGPETVQVSLRARESGQVLASAQVEVTAAGWTKYHAMLELKPGSVRRLEPVNFALSVEGNERVEVDEISLLPGDAVGTLDPEVIRMAAAMHMTELRLGGNFSSYYHWRDGVGPLDKRLAMKNIAWGIPEYNNFGTDEFLEFCRLVQAEPQFDLNMGSGTPEEAADWVKYIRERYQGPLNLEMGNELYGRWQVGYPAVNEIAARTLTFSKAIRPLAGDATVMATGDVPANFEAWNAAQLTNPPGTFDLLTTHFIIGTNHVRLRNSTPDFMAQAAYAAPYGIGNNLDRMQAQIDAVPGHQDTHLAVTEWLFNSKGAGERNFTDDSPSSRNEGGAVMIAGTFNTYLRRNSEIKLVDLTGLMEFAGIWKRREQVFASPAYYVFKMYSAAKGQTVLPVSTDSGTYSVANGTMGYADIQDVPYVDVAATRSPDGKEITLFCVNRSISLDEPVKFDLAKFRAAAGVISGEQIASVSRYMMNDEVEPQRVVPEPIAVRVAESQLLRITLPHESVTVLHLHAQE